MSVVDSHSVYKLRIAERGIEALVNPSDSIFLVNAAVARALGARLG